MARFLKCLLLTPVCFLVLRNIPCDFRGADNFPRVVANRRDRQRNIDDLAVLPYALRIVNLYEFSAAQAREDSGFFVAMVWRDQNRNRLADHLLRRVSED